MLHTLHVVISQNSNFNHHTRQHSRQGTLMLSSFSSSSSASSVHYPNKYLPFDKPLPSKSPVVSKVHEIITQAWGFKNVIYHNPSPNPISLERKYLPQLESEITDFVVAEKSDGVRYLMVLGTIGQKGFCVMVNRKMQMFEVPIFANSDFFKGSVFDGEMVVESVGHELERQKFLVYDLISIHGETRRTTDFIERYHEYFQVFDLDGKDIMECDISKWESDAFELANTKSKIVCLGNKMALQFAPKAFVQLVHVGSLWRSIPKLKHSSDGLVLTRVSSKIGTGTDANILKWKENHTVDLIITCNYIKGKWSNRTFFQDHEKLVESTDRFFDIFEKKYMLQICENSMLRSTCQYYAETHKTQFSLVGECLCVVTNCLSGGSAGGPGASAGGPGASPGGPGVPGAHGASAGGPGASAGAHGAHGAPGASPGAHGASAGAHGAPGASPGAHGASAGGPGASAGAHGAPGALSGPGVLSAPECIPHIVECSVVKWRRDKFTPNNSTVIQRTLGNIVDNVTIDELIQLTTKKCILNLFSS